MVMEPIVSPLFVYFLGISESISIVATGTFITGLVLAVFGIVLSVPILEYCKGNPRFGVFLKRIVVAWVSITVFGLLWPTKATLIGMYVASKVTTDTIKTATGELNEVREIIKGDIIDIVRTINDESNTKIER